MGIRPVKSVNIQQFIEIAVRHAQIEQDEDGMWVASIPELRGVYTCARTREELDDMLRDAVGLWLETAKEHDLPIPAIEGYVDP